MRKRENVEIISDSEESIEDFKKRGWGHSDYIITELELCDLLKGKLIAIDDGEYTSTIKLQINDNL